MEPARILIPVPRGNPMEDPKPKRKTSRRKEVKRKPSTATYATDDDPEPWRCAAKSKSTGERCGKHAEEGFRVCRLHGSRAGRPPKHGRFSAFTGRNREAYEKWLDAVDELDMSDHLAAMASVAERCIERAQELDTPEFRKQALKLFQQARSGSDPAEQARSLNELGLLLRKGGEEDSALRATAESLDRFAKRMEAAKSLDLQEQHTVRMRDLDAMMAGIISILLRHGEQGEQIASEIDSEIIRPAGILRSVG